MPYDSKSETEKEFGYSYEEIKSDPTPGLGDEYQDAKYVLSTLNRDHATKSRARRKSNNMKTIVAALAIGVTSVGAISVVLISNSKKDDNGQILINLPENIGEIQDISLIHGDFDYSSVVYEKEGNYYIDTLPLFSGTYKLGITEANQNVIEDETNIDADRGELTASCEISGTKYVLSTGTSNFDGYTNFETILFYQTLPVYFYDNGTLLCEAEVLEDFEIEVPAVASINYSVVTFGITTRYDGETIKVPLIGTSPINM